MKESDSVFTVICSICSFRWKKIFCGDNTVDFNLWLTLQNLEETLVVVPSFGAKRWLQSNLGNLHPGTVTKPPFLLHKDHYQCMEEILGGVTRIIYDPVHMFMLFYMREIASN